MAIVIKASWLQEVSRRKPVALPKLHYSTTSVTTASAHGLRFSVTVFCQKRKSLLRASCYQEALARAPY